jgi:hypothetical protein
MKFYLNFKSDNYGKKKIDEPFGTSNIKFSLKQKTDGGGMARDISFSGGNIEFEFTNMRDHQLKKLLYYRRKFGFEAIVVLTIEIDDDNKYNCDLDFATSETDDLTYFRCKGIEDSKLQIIKSRKKVKVDVTADLDIDGNFIGGLIPQNMLLLAKPVIQTSKWDLPQSGMIHDSLLVYSNFSYNLTKSDIENSLSPSFDNYPNINSFQNAVNKLVFIEAKNNLKNVNLLFDVNIDFIYKTLNNNASDNCTLRLSWLAFKDTYISPNPYVGDTIFSHTFTGDVDQSISINQIINANIGIELLRDYKLSLFWEIEKNILTTGDVDHRPYAVFNKCDVSVSAQSTAYNSISKSLRLVDVMRQVIKSISGLQINAPRFEALGQFYDNRLINGDFLRGIEKNGFKISLEDIENSLPEFKGDYEIGSDGKIFFGIESDFYQNNEIAFFNNTQFSKMNKTFNPKYTVNKFGFKYDDYQSLKENEEPNSADEIHGESEFVLFNKAVENEKKASVKWVRSAFLIEATRRKALEITEETASQDDDTIFCVDSIDTSFVNQFTETSLLQHTYDASNNRLILKNDGTINFISLGMELGGVFVINEVLQNEGTYTIFSITKTTLELIKTLGTNTSASDGIRNTKYTYSLSIDFVPFTNYTNQGFSETSGLNAAESYSNRRYSIARNIDSFWKSYLATCNLYQNTKEVKKTVYKNNPDYTAKYNDIKLREGDNLLPNNPILSPELYNDVVFKNVEFEDFISLHNSIRSNRGFIRAIDNNEKVIKLFPVDMDYSLKEKELIIKAEEKFEPTYMTILSYPDYIIINSETRVLALKWEIVADKLYLFDENRYRLYNGVFWFEVSVNGAIPNSLSQLEEWLNLI